METLHQTRKEEMKIETVSRNDDDDQVKPENLSDLSLSENEEEKEDTIASPRKHNVAVATAWTKEEEDEQQQEEDSVHDEAEAETEKQQQKQKQDEEDVQQTPDATEAIATGAEEDTSLIDQATDNTTDQEFDSLWASLDVSVYGTLVNKLYAGHRDSKRLLTYLNLRHTQAHQSQRSCIDMNQYAPRSEELTLRRVWDVTKYMNEANALAHQAFANDLKSQAIGTTEGLERHLRKSIEKIENNHRAVLHEYSERCKANAALANKTQKLTSAFYNSTADLKYVNTIAERLGGQCLEDEPSEFNKSQSGDGGAATIAAAATAAAAAAITEEITDEDEEGTDEDPQLGVQTNMDMLSTSMRSLVSSHTVRHSIVGGISKLKNKMLGSELSSLKWREKVAKLSEDLNKAGTDLAKSQSNLLRAEVVVEARVKTLMKELQALELNRMEIVQLVTKTAALLEHDLLDTLAQNNRRYRSVERSIEPRQDIISFFRHIVPNVQPRWETLTGNVEPISPEFMNTSDSVVNAPTSPTLNMLSHGKGTEFPSFSSASRPKHARDIYTNPNRANASRPNSASDLYTHLSQVGGKASKSGGSKRGKVKKFLKKNSSKFRSGSPTAYVEREAESENV